MHWDTLYLVAFLIIYNYLQCSCVRLLSTYHHIQVGLVKVLMVKVAFRIQEFQKMPYPCDTNVIALLHDAEWEALTRLKKKIFRNYDEGMSFELRNSLYI